MFPNIITIYYIKIYFNELIVLLVTFRNVYIDDKICVKISKTSVSYKLEYIIYFNPL